MKIYKILFFFFLISIFFNCKKENRINKNMVGTWTFVEYQSKSALMNDFSSEKWTFEFFKEKKAYTKTLRGVYKIDYVDPNRQDFVDTFKYELKKDELDISNVQHNNPVPKEIKFLFSKRFKIEEYKNDKLKLVRIDSTDLYIKATKQ